MNGYLAAGIGRGIEKGTKAIDSYDKEQFRRRQVAEDMDMKQRQLKSNLATQEQARTQSASKFQAYEIALKRQGDALQRMTVNYQRGQIQTGLRKFTATGDVTHINNILNDPEMAKKFGVGRVSQPNRQDPTIMQQGKKMVMDAKAKQAEGGVKGPATEGGETATDNFMHITDAEVESLLKNPLIVQDDKGKLIDMTSMIISTNSFQGMTQAERKNFDYQVAGLQDPNLNANFAKSQGTGGGADMKSTFGKFYSDMTQLGVPSEQIPEMFSQVEKNPAYGQAVRNLAKRGLPLTQGNIDNEVRAIKGTGTSGSGSKSAVGAFDAMTGFLGEKKIDVNDPNFHAEYSKLETKDKAKAKAFAKDYFKQSGEKLMPPDQMGRHLKTLSDVNASPDQMAEQIKDAAGLGDVAGNAVKSYFTTGEGIEFARTFKQTFNNLLMIGSKGRISNAELDNLREAFGGLAESNAVVFNNFRSMIKTMQAGMDAYSTVSPIAGQILYGDEMKAYDTVISVLDSIDTSGINTGGGSTGAYDKHNPGTPRNTYTFEGQ